MPRMLSAIADTETEQMPPARTDLDVLFRRNLGEVLARQPHGAKSELARKCGWNRAATITEILNGKREVDLKEVQTIADAVGCSTARLLRN